MFELSGFCKQISTCLSQFHIIPSLGDTKIILFVTFQWKTCIFWHINKATCMTDILSHHKNKKNEISQHREFSKFYTISDNPGQNIGDTFPNIVISLAHCYYIEQTSPIPPPINVVLLFSFLTDSTLFWGRGGKLRGLFWCFFIRYAHVEQIIRV